MSNMQAQKVIFIKEDTVNGETKSIGDVMSVSPSIFEKLVENGSIEIFTEKKQNKKEA